MEHQKKTLDVSMMEDFKYQLQNSNVARESWSYIMKHGSEDLVEKFLSEPGGEKAVTDEQTALQSQLYIAAFWGLLDTVKNLLAAGADINYANPGTGWTSLHAATFREQGPVVMHLLQQGAATSLQDEEGRTPADFASASDKIWPHFAFLQCKRTPRQKLVEMGVLRQKPSSTTHNRLQSAPAWKRDPGDGDDGSSLTKQNRPESAAQIYATSEAFTSAEAVDSFETEELKAKLRKQTDIENHLHF